MHLHVGTDQVSLTPPWALQLDDATSREALDAVRPLFESEGFTLHPAAPLQWLASHPMLDGLATAALDRVIGRNIDRWLPGQGDARLIRRLQNEVQMLLHQHPVNLAREARGELPVNANYRVPDPDCDLNFVLGAPHRQHVRMAMSNSFGFGGTNASLVLRALDG